MLHLGLISAILLVSVAAAELEQFSLEEQAAILDQHYSLTPAGYVLKHCIRKYPSGTTLQTVNGEQVAIHPGGEVVKVPKCERPLVGETALPVVVRNTLPPDYDGWLAYTAFNKSQGFDAFLGNFSVPHIPPRVAHILYLFTGLQNLDWIPLVDPESQGAGFDIIQPVLQYPGDEGHYWSVKSWYVTIDSGASASDELRVQPGDTIFGNMTRVGPTTWFVGSTSVSSGKTTSLNANHPRLRTQPWAYNVLEAYGVSGCQNYPDNTVLFSGLQLKLTGGAVLPPTQVQWRLNPKPNPHPRCHERITVQSGSNMVVSFQQ
eukprot:m.224364 g.224364  ORF g.224364 m.224364 type:complete len:318 (-) comp16454_c0_seq1:115-1068(-)